MSSKKKKKVYVGFALAGSDDAFKNSIFALIETLKESYEVLGFYQGKASKNNEFGEGFKRASREETNEIFEFDVMQVRAADFMIAICSQPSIGLGYEICYGLILGKQVIAVAREGEDISNMVTGIAHPKFSFTWVKDFNEVPEVVTGNLL